MYHYKPLPVLIADRAKNSPDDVAVESLSTEESITWEQLDSRSRLWAAAFKRLNVEPHEYVITLMPNTPDAMYAWIGVSWTRAVEVPVNNDYRGDWLSHAINTSRARVVVTSRRFLGNLSVIADQLPEVRIVVIYDAEPGDDTGRLEEHFHVLSGEEFLGGLEPAENLPEPQQWDLLSVIYTSGTTGKAKAVLVPWGAQENVRLLYAPEEFHGATFYGFWPPFHVLGKSTLFLPAALGGKLVFRERFSITDFWDDIRAHNCTATYTVSVIASFLMAMPEKPDDADNPLKAVLMGPVLPEVDDFKRRFGVEQVYTTFGSTELGSVLYSHGRDVDGTNWRSVGRIPEDGPTDVAVVDEHDQPVGPGEVGELVVRPKVPWTLNQGYLNNPEATVKAWRNGWFHTGDAFTYDEDGEHYFVDRAKDYIRRRGENISSFEVEQAVSAYPGVSSVAAVAVPSDVGEDEVMIFVVAAAEAVVKAAELCKFLENRMPKFALPRYVELLESLPTTQATFRIQKVQLRERGVGPDTFDRLSPQG